MTTGKLPPDLRLIRGRERANRQLCRVGGMLAIVGALAVLVGSALPWARFTLFGVAFVIPGLLTGWGTAAALGATAVWFTVRRWPVLGVVLGVALMGVGLAGVQTVGESVVRGLLRVENAIAPINDKLSQVALPNIVVTPGVSTRESYVGPGPLWVIWGGAIVAVGSAAQFAGGRLGRTCLSCGALWPNDRAVVFCPRCGVQNAPEPYVCRTCRAPLLTRDQFCVCCGARTPANNPPAAS